MVMDNMLKSLEDCMNDGDDLDDCDDYDLEEVLRNSVTPQPFHFILCEDGIYRTYGED